MTKSIENNLGIISPEESQEATAEREKKLRRGLIAVSFASLWGAVKILGELDPLPIGGTPKFTEKEREDMERDGFLKTMWGKTKETYKFLGKLEDTFDKGDIDGLFEDEED